MDHRKERRAFSLLKRMRLASCNRIAFAQSLVAHCHFMAFSLDESRPKLNNHMIGIFTPQRKAWSGNYSRCDFRWARTRNYAQ
jgi:hypothetical protein